MHVNTYGDLDLIGIREVAGIFGVSLQHARRYESAGIVRRADRHGNKHMFPRADTLLALELWVALRNTHTVAEAGRIIDDKRQNSMLEQGGPDRAALAREVLGSR